MDLQLANEKRVILGRDFLTWLWFKSEQQNGMFKSRSGEDFSLYLEQKVVVEGGEGESLEKAVCTGMMSELREAKLGLRTGKKVAQAKIRLEQDANEWIMQVDASDFIFSGLKTPKVDTKVEEGDDPDSILLEKMFLVEKALGFLDDIYTGFVDLRLSIHWQGEVESFKKWLYRDED
nr:hypothetical protein [Desulfonatronovibrio hydrogenovorans]